MQIGPYHIDPPVILAPMSGVTDQPFRRLVKRSGAGLVVSLPISMLLGSETWDRYDGHGMNKVPGVQAVAVATGIGLVELASVAAAFMLLLRL